MMYGEGAWPGMMASGFFLFFAVLGALAMIVWLIVGILLIIWLAKKIRVESRNPRLLFFLRKERHNDLQQSLLKERHGPAQ